MWCRLVWYMDTNASEEPHAYIFTSPLPWRRRQLFPVEQLPIQQITWRHTPEWPTQCHIAFEISHHHVVVFFVFPNADLLFSICNIFLNHIHLFYHTLAEFWSWDSIFCIVTRLWDEIEVRILAVARNRLQTARTGSGVHPASYSMSTRGPFSRDKVVRAWGQSHISS